jgi:hypothetical protein
VPTTNELLRKSAKDVNGKTTKPTPLEDTVFQFWFDQKNRVPLFSRWFREFALLQPTSAGAERVFSLYRHLFFSQVCYEDTVAVRTICHYNAKVAQKIS